MVLVPILPQTVVVCQILLFTMEKIEKVSEFRKKLRVQTPLLFLSTSIHRSTIT
jgi:hypothetical protein